MPHVYRMLVITWNWWAWACGGLILAYLPAWGIISYFYHGHNAVSIHSDQRLLTPRVTPGGDLIYVVTVDRRRTCRGVVSDIFETAEPGTKTQISRVRPIFSNKIESNRRLRTIVAVPLEMPPGLTHFRSSLISDCPEGQIIDLIFATDFNVIPS